MTFLLSSSSSSISWWQLGSFSLRSNATEHRPSAKSPLQKNCRGPHSPVEHQAHTAQPGTPREARDPKRGGPADGTNGSPRAFPFAPTPTPTRTPPSLGIALWDGQNWNITWEVWRCIPLHARLSWLQNRSINYSFFYQLLQSHTASHFFRRSRNCYASRYSGPRGASPCAYVALATSVKYCSIFCQIARITGRSIAIKIISLPSTLSFLALTYRK